MSQSRQLISSNSIISIMMPWGSSGYRFYWTWCFLWNPWISRFFIWFLFLILWLYFLFYLFFWLLWLFFCWLLFLWKLFSLTILSFLELEILPPCSSHPLWLWTKHLLDASLHCWMIRYQLLLHLEMTLNWFCWQGLFRVSKVFDSLLEWIKCINNHF